MREEQSVTHASINDFASGYFGGNDYQESQALGMQTKLNSEVKHSFFNRTRYDMDGQQDHGAKSFKNSIASPKQSRNNQLERPQWQ